MDNVEFDRTAADYRKYRAGFPPEMFSRLAAFQIGLPGQSVLDLGTGTGTVARQLAGRGATVVALDKATALIEEAQALDAEAGVTVDYVEGVAERLEFEDARFDVVAAGQCWHWFDRARTASETFRVLKRGGRIAIVHFDWIPQPGNVVAATEELIMQFNPSWNMDGGNGMHPEWCVDLSLAGFGKLESFSFDLAVPYSHEAWRGRIRASAGVAATLEHDEVERFDREHAEILRKRFAETPLQVPHRVWALIGRKPPAP